MVSGSSRHCCHALSRPPGHFLGASPLGPAADRGDRDLGAGPAADGRGGGAEGEGGGPVPLQHAPQPLRHRLWGLRGGGRDGVDLTIGVLAAANAPQVMFFIAYVMKAGDFLMKVS